MGVAGFLLLELAIDLGQSATAESVMWGMSLRRSRSGGKVIEKTERRSNRSSRNVPAEMVFVEVAIGGGDHADVDGNLAMIADSADRPRNGASSAGRLQHSQQLRLGLQIAFADFIQKQRAAVGQLEGSLAVSIGSGEGTFDMAEEFRFQQSL